MFRGMVCVIVLTTDMGGRCCLVEMVVAMAVTPGLEVRHRPLHDPPAAVMINETFRLLISIAICRRRSG